MCWSALWPARSPDARSARKTPTSVRIFKARARNKRICSSNGKRREREERGLLVACVRDGAFIRAVLLARETDDKREAGG